MSDKLLAAIEQGDVATVRSLVQQSPEMASIDDDDGISAVMHSLYRGRRDIAEILVDAGAALGTFELMALGPDEAIDAHFDRVPDAVSEHSADGFTPLHMAAFFANVHAVEELLKRGADANALAENPSHVTPLHSAVAARSIPISSRLLDAGADPNSAQHGGWTALHSAAKHGELELTKILVAHGADPSATADDGSTPISMATSEGHVRVLALLRPPADPEP